MENSHCARIVRAGAACMLLRLRESNLIITLAGRHKLPAVYNERSFIAAGGLISYGPDFVDMYRQAAGYVDRILKGEKPADLPVQAPTKLFVELHRPRPDFISILAPADASSADLDWMNAELSRAGSDLGALYAGTDVAIANLHPDKPMKIAT